MNNSFRSYVSRIAVAAFASGVIYFAASFPAQAQLILPGGTVNAELAYDQTNNLSYFTVTLSGVPNGTSVVNGTYLGWCADYRTPHISPEIVLLSDTTQLAMTNNAWSSINWILNNKPSLSYLSSQTGVTDAGALQAIQKEVVQQVIWALLTSSYDEPTSATSFPLFDNGTAPGHFGPDLVDPLLAQALSNANFVPQNGQIIGVLLTPTTGGQPVVIEIPPCTIPASQTIISGTSWNKFNTKGSPNYVWVHAHIGAVTGLSTTSVTTVSFSNVTFTAGPARTQYPMPDGLLIFDPLASATPTTVFDPTFMPNGRWTTTFNPKHLSDEMFFVGSPILVDHNISNGGQANFSYTVITNDPQFQFNWQWSAAVYTFWPSDNNLALILPDHATDHAGTPLNKTVEKSLIQGPRGGGGSNFTGSWSATGHGTCLGNSH